MTESWLDSAYAPSASQVAQAKAAGYSGWAGYFAGANILNGWAKTDFDRVKAGGLRTLAYCSGWASATAMKDQSSSWAVPICLDDEGGIRPDGTWVQPWLDASGAGLYGNYWVHSGRRAAFHVLAAYPTGGDPSDASWWGQTPRPAGICAWQWAGSHSWAGITVDSTWADAGFPGLSGASNSQLTGAIPTGGRMLTFRPGGPDHRFDLAWLLNGRVWRAWGSNFDQFYAVAGYPAGSTELPDLGAVTNGVVVAELLGFAWNQDGSLCCLSVVGSDGLLYGMQIDINGGSSGWRRLGAGGSATLAASLPAAPSTPDDDAALATKAELAAAIAALPKPPSTGTIDGPITVKLS